MNARDYRNNFSSNQASLFYFRKTAQRDSLKLDDSLGKLYQSSKEIEVLTLAVIFYSVINIVGFFLETKFYLTAVGTIYVIVMAIVAVVLGAYALRRKM